MLALLIPYLLFPLAMASILLRTRWHDELRVIVPLAMGLGPFLFTWLLEIILSVAPGPDSAAVALPALGCFALAVLLVSEWRGRLSWVRQGWSWPPVLAGASIGLLVWLAAGNRMLFSWDPQTNRLIADRIAAEGLVDPARLIFEPTAGDLILIHAYHGLRYLLLMATHRLAWSGDFSPPAAWDEIPAIWFLVCAVLLTGGMLARAPGWRDWRPWAAGALMLSSFDFLAWPLAGNTAGSFSAFACAAVFLTSMHAAATPAADPRLGLRWIMVGVALGLMMGAHRTILLLGIVPSCFALAAGAISGQWRVLAWATAGALTSVLLFCPFGYQLTFHVGDWSVANPVSDALVPYRETWREAFRPHPWRLSTVQFTTIDKGALVWWGGLASGVLLLVSALRSGEWRQRPLAWAFGISLLVMSLLIADIAQILRLSGVSELIVRATRYRQMVVPMLAYVTVLGIGRLLPDRSSARHRPDAMRGRLIAVVGLVAVTAVLMTTLGKRLPPSPGAVRERLETMFATSDRDNVMRYSPEHGEVLRRLEPRAGAGRTYLDWMPLVAYVPGRIANPWMPPGLFGLMEATDPEAAWRAAGNSELERMLMRIGRGDMEIYSATGLRLFQSLRVSRLLFDGRFLQLFERRAAPLPPLAAVEQMLTPQLAAVIDQPSARITRPLRMFSAPITRGGDYELAISFASKGGTLRVIEDRSGKRSRVFRLKSWQPYTPGPQRIRFNIDEGDEVNFRLALRGASSGVSIADISLYRAERAESEQGLAPDATGEPE